MTYPLLQTAALQPTDVVPRRLYEATRPGYLREMIALRRIRRIELGEHATLSFESRETVLFQLQEVLRANNLWDRRHVAQAIGDLQHLVPTGDALVATFMLHGGERQWGRQLCERLLERPREVLRLRLGSRFVGAEQVSPPSDPHCPVHYVRFAVGAEAGDALCDLAEAARVTLRDPFGSHTMSLAESTRLELARDLHPYRRALGPL